MSSQSYPRRTALGEVTISLLNLQMAMVPVWSISFWERVETRASSAASFTTSTRTFPGGAWPRSCASAARCASSASSA